MTVWRTFALLTCLVALAACGPQIGDLERGEEARVVRAYNGDTLELDNGLRVFLAEIDAPRGEEDYAAQAQGELEAQALHREVLLAYGGTRRWAGRAREDGTTNEAAIAHVFVRAKAGVGFGYNTNWSRGGPLLCGRGATIMRAQKNSSALKRRRARRNAGCGPDAPIARSAFAPQPIKRSRSTPIACAETHPFASLRVALRRRACFRAARH